MAALVLGSAFVEPSRVEGQTRIWDEAGKSMPLPTVHPLTGEEGMWIPRWLQRQHLEDAARLKACIVELSIADDEIDAQQTESEELRAVTEIQDETLQKIMAAHAAETEAREREEQKAERYAVVTWAAVVGAMATTALAVFAFAR